MSIAQIISILKRISKRNLRIVTQADVKSNQYQRVVQFKSKIEKNYTQKNLINLTEGISILMDTMQKDIFKNGNRL